MSNPYDPSYHPEPYNLDYDEESQAYVDSETGNLYRDSQGYEQINDDD